MPEFEYCSSTEQPPGSAGPSSSRTLTSSSAVHFNRALELRRMQRKGVPATTGGKDSPLHTLHTPKSTMRTKVSPASGGSKAKQEEEEKEEHGEAAGAAENGSGGNTQASSSPATATKTLLKAVRPGAGAAGMHASLARSRDPSHFRFVDADLLLFVYQAKSESSL